jgi:hypothetical protein
MNIYHERNVVSYRYEKYLEISVVDDEKIFEIVCNEIKIADNSDNVIAFIIKNENVINKFTIKLIGAIIKIVNGERKRRLELIIEKQKDILLGSSRKDLSKWPGVQGKISRYGLIPITISMNISELFGTLKLEYEKELSNDENFTRAAKEIGIIILNIATPNPIEFSLRGLIDIDFINAHDLKTNPASGLTKKILERFNTAKLLPKGSNSAPMVKYPAKIKSNKWYIFETLNGILYRQLGRNGRAIITSEDISGLLVGLSTRAQVYNLIQSNDIVAKCFDPKNQLVLSSYKDDKKVVHSSEPIKASIINQLSTWFDKQITEHVPKSAQQVKSMAINSAIITEVLLDTLTHSTGIYGKGSSEYLVTYIAKFDSIIHKFIRELERRWGDEKISNMLFKERTGNDLHKYLMNMYTHIVKLSADEMDKSNVWTEYDISLKEYFLEQKQVVV